MRVSFDLSEKLFASKFEDIRIGEYFGIDMRGVMRIGIKTDIHEALIYGDNDKINPTKMAIEYVEEIVPYYAVVALREDRGIKKCEQVLNG